MADTVTVTKVKDVEQKACFVLTNHSDGTGETLAQKIDITSLNSYQTGCTFAISKVKYCVSGVASVKLIFDGATDKTALVLSGNGEFDLSGNIAAPILDNSVTPVGALLLSTIGFVANSTYTIVIEVTKKGTLF